MEIAAIVSAVVVGNDVDFPDAPVGEKYAGGVGCQVALDLPLFACDADFSGGGEVEELETESGFDTVAVFDDGHLVVHDVFFGCEHAEVMVVCRGVCLVGFG